MSVTSDQEAEFRLLVARAAESALSQMTFEEMSRFLEKPDASAKIQEGILSALVPERMDTKMIVFLLVSAFGLVVGLIFAGILILSTSPFGPPILP